MLNNVLVKSIYEKRWGTMVWFLAVLFNTVLITALFPTFKEAFGKSLNDVPESMKAFLGDSSNYQNIAGYVDIQVVAQMVFLTIIMSVIVGSGFIAGDENNKTLQSLLTQPVSRSKIYLQKIGALIVINIIVVASLAVGVYFTALILGEQISILRVVQSNIEILGITLLFGIGAFSLGAIIGKRALAGSIVGGLAFLTYMISALAVGIDKLRQIDTISPFHYFNKPSVLQNGIDYSNLLLIIVMGLVIALIGLLIFNKRDISN